MARGPVSATSKILMTIILFIFWFMFIVMFTVSYSKQVDQITYFLIMIAGLAVFLFTVLIIWLPWIETQKVKPTRKIKRKRRRK